MEATGRGFRWEVADIVFHDALGVLVEVVICLVARASNGKVGEGKDSWLSFCKAVTREGFPSGEVSFGLGQLFLHECLDPWAHLNAEPPPYFALFALKCWGLNLLPKQVGAVFWFATRPFLARGQAQPCY